MGIEKNKNNTLYPLLCVLNLNKKASQGDLLIIIRRYEK